MNQNSSEQMKYIEITQAGGPEVLKVVQGKKPEIKEDAILPKMSPLNPQYLTKKQTVFQKIADLVEKFKGVGGKV